MAFYTLTGAIVSLQIGDLCQWAAWLGLLYLLFKVSKLYLIWRDMVTTFRPFPSPLCHWLYGNAREFLQIGKELDLIYQWAQSYTYGFPLWLGNFFACLIITHPDYAKAVLARQDPKDDLAYRFIIPWIGEGLLVSAGQKWFQHRRLLTPAFHYDVLKPYVSVMSDCTKIMLDKWEQVVPDKNPLELFHYVSLMTLDTIMKCAFNYQSNVQTDSENAYIKAVYELSHLVDHRFRHFMYHNDLIYNLSPYGFRFRRALKVAHEHTDKVIKQRKTLLNSEKQLDKISQRRHLDFLDVLLCAKDENGHGLSDKDLRAEVDTFMFEGHDTTASGISWILYALAKHPEHQERCREEIKEVLGERDTVEWEDLGKIPYTTMCIKESLRVYPPVPGVARKLSKPITFCDGRSLPEGARIILSIYCINRSPYFWKDPEVFDPLRFSVENSAGRHPHAFLPFAAGFRNCIGQNFAMNEMKVAVALILQRFQLILDPENEPQKVCQIVLRSMNGIHLNLKKIENGTLKAESM
ncbi:cytochrome P450 4A4-like [Bufo gargarizans]|uniref:cytochrome P450 4A4-like n=1 Tax=Bufo gargarizans TaxID=30331 RepID=UPI001CF4063A|nr:cytochrome P450 4A4-like [Bufo gargarizans]